MGSAGTEPPDQPLPQASHGTRNKGALFSSVAFFVLLLLLVGGRAYQDLFRPEAWAHWKDSYFSPSMTSTLIANADPDGSGRRRPALAISGTIGAATAGWF